jgi:peptidoglycan/xylan/chitin deacetylase (PgdA/CDA1 family)
VSPAPPGTIVFRGPTDSGRIALTFDDGPSECTSEVLTVLERHRAKATFFMLGSEVETHVEIALSVRDAGHEIGLHSMTHLDHDQHQDKALADVREGAAAIERELGIQLCLFRPPYGHFFVATLRECESRGWTPVYWSAWGLDWGATDAQAIAGRVIEDLAPGTIVLLHDGRREKAFDCQRLLEALELILAEAERRGLEPVTVSELLAA